MLNKKSLSTIIIIAVLGVFYASYLIIKNPQPFGKIAVLAFVIFGITVFINHNIFRKIVQISSLLVALLFCVLGTRSLLFNISNANIFETKTEVVFSELSFSESLKKAELENKLIFVDFYTVWCAPCIKFHKEVLDDKEAATNMNNTFINLKYNLYEGEGITLKDKYNVYYVPRFLILDTKGNIIEDIPTESPLTLERINEIAKKYINY